MKMSSAFYAFSAIFIWTTPYFIKIHIKSGVNIPGQMTFSQKTFSQKTFSQMKFNRCLQHSDNTSLAGALK